MPSVVIPVAWYDRYESKVVIQLAGLYLRVMVIVLPIQKVPGSIISP